MSSTTGRDVSVSRLVWTPPAELLELAREGGVGIIQQVFDDFRSDTVSRLQTLRQAVQSGDAVATRREAHAIKGGAVQVGADTMARLCQLMESPDGAAEMAWLTEQLQVEFDKIADCIAMFNLREALAKDEA